jgi:hypothetical protein
MGALDKVMQLVLHPTEIGPQVRISCPEHVPQQIVHGSIL